MRCTLHPGIAMEPGMHMIPAIRAALVGTAAVSVRTRPTASSKNWLAFSGARSFEVGDETSGDGPVSTAPARLAGKLVVGPMRGR